MLDLFLVKLSRMLKYFFMFFRIYKLNRRQLLLLLLVLHGLRQELRWALEFLKLLNIRFQATIHL